MSAYVEFTLLAILYAMPPLVYVCGCLSRG